MFNSDSRHRHSFRLLDYDYSQEGSYFVTICSYNRECLFGGIVNHEMRLSEYGKIVLECWQAIPMLFLQTSLDAFIVMPNHLYGIIVLSRGDRARHASPLPKQPKGPKPNSIGSIIGSFKSAATRKVNQVRLSSGVSIWQRNYYEHVIRDETDLNSIR